MATNAVTNPTLLDLAKLTDPNGGMAEVVRLMDQTNQILQFFSFMEGNLPTGHRTTVATGLPTPVWRSLYGGVQPSTGKRVQVTENCGELVSYSLVDKSLVDIAPNPAGFRMQEDMDHVEALGQKLAKAIFYSNEDSSPEEITGLSPRYNSKSAGNARNILDAGGTGSDNGSIWLIVSSPSTVTGIVPRNGKAFVEINDKGVMTMPVSNATASEIGAPSGELMEAYVTHFVVHSGVSVRNWKYAVRICNIDKSELKKDISGNSADLPDLMYQAIRRIPSMGRGRAFWCMSEDMQTWLGRQLASEIKSSTLEIKDVGGVMLEHFRGIPIAQCDALEADEARVT